MFSYYFLFPANLLFGMLIIAMGNPWFAIPNLFVSGMMFTMMILDYFKLR